MCHTYHMRGIDLTKGNHSQTFAFKIKRAVWMVAWVWVQYLPSAFSPLRVSLLRLFGAQVGERCLICSGVKILMPWNLRLDDYVAIGRSVEIYNFTMVSIGRMTMVSQYTYLCTGSHDYTDRAMPLVYKPIFVGNECWVAANVFIHPGVVIESGAVIGARAVVTKSMPAWMICAGHPCKPIKSRILQS